MASRGKKKTQARGTQAPVVQVVNAKKDNRWIIVSAAALVLLAIFLFLNSFTIQGNIEYTTDDGTNVFEDVDKSELSFAKSAVTIIFAPVNGYEGAVDYTIKNLPLLSGSDMAQDIAKQFISSYPQSKLDLLDSAYNTIYVTELAYCVLSLAYFVMLIVVLVRRKEGDDVIALAGTSVMTAFSAARLIIGLIMCMQSTSDFLITAGGAPWLALVVTAAATVLLAVLVAKRLKEKKAAATEKKQ